MPVKKPDRFDDINLEKPDIKNRSLKKVHPDLKEMEQGFLLARNAYSAGDLQSTLRSLASKKNGWSHVGTITQAVIDPEQIPKTRLRITRTPDDKIEAVVTFKGINSNTTDSDELTPRFEIDLPIDLKALEKKYAHLGTKAKPWHASDSINELLAYGGYGTVTKDRYKHVDAKGRTFDVDLYHWGDGVMDAVEEAVVGAVKGAGESLIKAAQSLYQNLAVVDVELKDNKDRVRAIEDFPEALHPFLVVNSKKQTQPVEITGDARFKGRRLTAFEGAAGHFNINASTCTLIDTVAHANGAKQK